MPTQTQNTASQRAKRSAQSGFTLIEALIATLVLSFGLISISNLMIVSTSTNYIAFLSSANVSSDLFSIKFIIGGEERETFLGAELSGSNANACAANACERGECVGAIETLTLRITNITAAAFAANATASVRLARYFPGDGVRYTCDRDRNALVKTATDCKTGCAVPGTQGTPVL